MTKDCATYINDHLAGSVAAVGLIDDLLAGEIDLSLKSVLTSVRREIGEEQEVLRSVLAADGMPEETAKKGLAWLAEKLSRLKLGSMGPDGDCLPVIQALEVLHLGITGKWLGWHVLQNVMSPKLAELGADIDMLQSRALAQRDLIEQHRLACARRAFAETP